VILDTGIAMFCFVIGSISPVSQGVVLVLARCIDFPHYLLPFFEYGSPFRTEAYLFYYVIVPFLVGLIIDKKRAKLGELR
jgi:hypothetical protein